MTAEAVRNWAATMNNRGVQAANDGDWGTALACLRYALQVMRPSQDDDDDDDDQQQQQQQQQCAPTKLTNRGSQKRSRSAFEQGAQSQQQSRSHKRSNGGQPDRQSRVEPQSIAAADAAPSSRLSPSTKRSNSTASAPGATSATTDHGNSPFFCGGIVINDAILRHSEECFVNDGLCYAIIIFNLATALHRSVSTPPSPSAEQGQSLQEQRRLRVLQKALILYQSCSRLFSKTMQQRGGGCGRASSGMGSGSSGSTGTLTGTVETDLLFMATYNNMACIRYELLDYAGCQMLLKRLVHFATLVVPQQQQQQQLHAPRDEHHDDQIAMLNKQKSIFLQNSVLLKTPTGAQAA